jgi:hypothetical protein
VVEQGGLPGAEVPGQRDDGDTPGSCGPVHAVPSAWAACARRPLRIVLSPGYRGASRRVMWRHPA